MPYYKLTLNEAILREIDTYDEIQGTVLLAFSMTY